MRTIPFLAAAALLVLAGSALADEASEREARALFLEGKSFVAAGDYTSALDRFQRAYTLFPSVKLRLNIATMYRELGRDVEAANGYQRYLADPAADPEKKVEVQRALAALDARLGLLRIQVSSPDILPRLDGRLEREPGELVLVRVEPGAHVLTAERGGAVVVTQTVTVAAGQARDVVLKAPAAPEPTGVPGVPVPSMPPAAAVPVPSMPPAAAVPVPSMPPAAADTAPPPPPSLTHRRQLGAVARADVDGRGRGVAGAFGASFGLGDYVEVSTSALVGRSKGVEPALTAFALRGAVKPMFSAGVPIFFVDGAHPGARLGAGVEWDPIRHFGLFAQAAVSLFPSVPQGYDHVVFVPNAGVQGRVF